MPLVNYYLPTELTVAGVQRAIRSDYRPAVDICIAMQDEELMNYDKVAIVLNILYIDPLEPEVYTEALSQALNFLSCSNGTTAKNKQSKQNDLIFWQYDFDLFVPALSRVAGRDIRGMEYLHWWSFMGLFQEIGDCFFSRVMAIRDAKATHRKLTDDEKMFLKRHRDIIDPRLQQLREQDLEFMQKMGLVVQ